MCLTLLVFVGAPTYAADSPQLTATISTQVVSQGSDFNITAKIQNGISKIYNASVNFPDINSISYSTTKSISNFNIGDLDPNTLKTYDFVFTLDSNTPNGVALIDKITNNQNVDIKLFYQLSANNSDTLTQSFNVSLPFSADHSPAINKINLPNVYLKKGSSTTNFKTIKPEEVTNFKDLRIDDIDRNSIKWNVPIDLSQDTLLPLLSKLDTYIDISSIGKVRLDGSLLPQLNKPANILFRNLKFNTQPNIFKDGKILDLSTDTISNIKFDKAKRYLTFDVNSFSEYALGPIIKLNSFDQSDIKNILQGNVNEPTADVKYSIDGGKSFLPIYDIDVDSGNFTLNLPSNFDKSLFVIKAVSSNGISDIQYFDKVISVVSPTIVVSPTPRPSNQDKNPFNILLAYSIIGALIAVLIFVIAIILIARNYKKQKNIKKPSNNLNDDTFLTRVKILNEMDKKNENPTERTISSK